jgi:thiamine-phosphate pyrophosphorylase
MKQIIISDPEFLLGEHEIVHALFDAGLETFHLRKPGADQKQTEAFLKEVKPKYLKRIVLHQQYQLVNTYNIKGVHLKEPYFISLSEDELKEMVLGFKKKDLTVSASIHNPEDLNLFNQKLSYCFLSPVFKSISKEGHCSEYNLLDLPETKQNVVALGGIDHETIGKLSGKGFSGYALLGAIWQPYRFNRNLKEVLDCYNQINEIGNSLLWKKDLTY